MKLPEGMTAKAVPGPEGFATFEVTVTTPVHRCPPDGSGITPCCGRAPFELPRWHRMTEDGSLVTCSGVSA
jgi:hypothetical protein